MRIPVIVMLMIAALNQGQALTKAKTIWGPDAQVVKKKVQAGFIYQVGCTLNGNFVPVGQSIINWDDAFTHVDLNKNGKRTVQAVSHDVLGNTQQTSTTVWACNP